MQAVTPVDIHVDKDWQGRLESKENIRTFNRKDRQATRMRTRVLNKSKPKKFAPSSVKIPKQAVVPKLVPQSPPRTPSPNRGPWYEGQSNESLKFSLLFRIPPPGRATKGQKLSWQVRNVLRGIALHCFIFSVTFISFGNQPSHGN